jgi:hypothetical protein
MVELDPHPVVVHIIIVALCIALQLRLVPVERVFENRRSFRVTLLVNSKILVGLHVITVKNMLNYTLPRDCAQG